MVTQNWSPHHQWPTWKNQQIENRGFILKIKNAAQENQDLFGKELDEVIQLLKGEVGSVVQLLLQKSNGETKDIIFLRIFPHKIPLL